MRPTLLFAFLLLLVSCTGDVAPLVASDVKVTRPMPAMQMSAGYLTLTNNTAAPITITHVSSPQFGKVELHESIIEDGIARMVPLGTVTVPGGASLVFEPGGKHLMLMRPDDELRQVTLEFHGAEDVLLTVSVTLGE